jgi:hypothetical protein
MIRTALLIQLAILSLQTFAQPCNQQVIASFSPTTTCTGRPLTLQASTVSGASYSWTGPASTTASTQNFTISSPGILNSGDYIVTATVGSCVYKDTVTISMELTPAKPFAYSNQPLCIGDTLKLTATSNLQGGFSTVWGGPFGNTGIIPNLGNMYVKPNAQITDTGIYYTVSYRNGCYSDTAKVHVDSISAKPSALIITGATSYCEGSTILLNWSSISSGVSYSYYLNSMSGLIGPGTGQVFSFPNAKVYNSGWFYASAIFKGCAARDSVHIFVKPNNPPTIAISANPDTNIFANTHVTFTGNYTNGGPTPTHYMWTLNKAIALSGQNYNIPNYANSSLQDGDQVCLWVKIDSTCASVDTAIKCVNLHVTAVHITGVESNKEFTIYPNPNSGKFYIDALDKETLEIRNTLGQVIYTHIIKEGKNEINTGNLAEGAYILSLRSGLEVRTSSLIIRH